MILNLSFPTLNSVSNDIYPEICLMTYSSVDQAAKIIVGNALLAKIDLAHAYRIIPVHPQDSFMLGPFEVYWNKESSKEQVLHGFVDLVSFLCNLDYASGVAGGGAKGALAPPFSRENATRVLCTMINYSQNKLLLTFLREICCQYR